jgi:hypothetical protein
MTTSAGSATTSPGYELAEVVPILVRALPPGPTQHVVEPAVSTSTAPPCGLTVPPMRAAAGHRGSAIAGAVAHAPSPPTTPADHSRRRTQMARHSARPALASGAPVNGGRA